MGINWPWLGLRAMLPEFKASSKRLNIVCNLEAEKKKGQNTANLTKWNDSINATRAHNTTVFIDNIMTKQMHTPGGLCTRGNTVEIVKMLWIPLISSNMWRAGPPAPLRTWWQVGVSNMPAENHKQLNFARSSSGDLTHFKERQMIINDPNLYLQMQQHQDTMIQWPIYANAPSMYHKVSPWCAQKKRAIHTVLSTSPYLTALQLMIINVAMDASAQRVSHVVPFFLHYHLNLSFLLRK